MGKQGLIEVGRLNLQKSHYAAGQLAKVPGVTLPHASPFFNEFVIKLPAGTSVADVNAKLLKQGFLGGYDLGRAYPELEGHMLVAVTERRTKEQIDQFVSLLEGCL